MASFNPGTGGTLKSTSIEAAFLECAEYVQDPETALNLNNVNVTYNSDALNATINATIPVTSTIGTGGAVTYSAVNALSDTFLPGGGDLGATHGYAALMELAYLLQEAESGLTTPINNISVTINDENRTATIAANMPITIGVNALGRPEIIADVYAV